MTPFFHPPRSLIAEAASHSPDARPIQSAIADAMPTPQSPHPKFTTNSGDKITFTRFNTTCIRRARTDRPTPTNHPINAIEASVAGSPQTRASM